MVKKSACNAGDSGLIPGQEDLLQKGMATHSSILSWRFPWTEEPGELPFMGLQRVGHDLATEHAVEIILCKERGGVKKKKSDTISSLLDSLQSHHEPD